MMTQLDDPSAEFEPWWLSGPLAGAGSAWALVDVEVRGYPPYPFTPAGFVERYLGNGAPSDNLRHYIRRTPDKRPGSETPEASVGLEYLLTRWGGDEDKYREYAVLWRHLLSEAAVLAVPTAGWRGSGRYEFFHVTGPGKPITHLSVWESKVNSWTNDSYKIVEAGRRAQILGSHALGIALPAAALTWARRDFE